MDPLAQVPSISYIAPDRIELVRWTRAAILDAQPVAIRRQVIDAGDCCLHLPVNPLDAKGSVQPHELRDVGAGERPRKTASKQSARRNLAAGFRAAKVREPRQVGGGLVGNGIAVVLRKRDVACQRHPIVLSHLRRFFGAAESRGSNLNKRMRIGTGHFKSESGLRVGQLSAGPEPDCLKVRSGSGCQRGYKGIVGGDIDFAEVVVWQSFREIPNLVGVELFVAVGGMIGDGQLQFCFGGSDPEVAGLLRSLVAKHWTDVRLGYVLCGQQSGRRCSGSRWRLPWGGDRSAGDAGRE